MPHATTINPSADLMSATPCCAVASAKVRHKQPAVTSTSNGRQRIVPFARAPGTTLQRPRPHAAFAAPMSVNDMWQNRNLQCSGSHWGNSLLQMCARVVQPVASSQLHVYHPSSNVGSVLLFTTACQHVLHFNRNNPYYNRTQVWRRSAKWLHASQGSTDDGEEQAGACPADACLQLQDQAEL